MTIFNRSRTAALLMVAMLLGGCSSLLGGGKPADLFRFGIAEQSPVPKARTALPAHSVTLLRPHFAQEVEGDRILTTRGDRALYIKGARWVVPVPDLFTQAVIRQYAARAADIRLTGGRSATGASHALQINIERFEARYDVGAGEKAPPTVIIEGNATLFDLADRQPVASSPFRVDEPVSTNTASGIVSAFDRAVGRYTTAVTDWSAETVRMRPQ